jgi:hypothetical protein
MATSKNNVAGVKAMAAKMASKRNNASNGASGGVSGSNIEMWRESISVTSLGNNGWRNISNESESVKHQWHGNERNQ